MLIWILGEITEESAVDVEKSSFDSGLLGDDAYACVEQPRHAVQDAPQLAKVLVTVIPSQGDWWSEVSMPHWRMDGGMDGWMDGWMDDFMFLLGKQGRRPTQT